MPALFGLTNGCGGHSGLIQKCNILQLLYRSLLRAHFSLFSPHEIEQMVFDGLGGRSVFLTSCEKDDPDNVNKVDISGKNNQEVLMIQPWAFYSYSQTMKQSIPLTLWMSVMKDDGVRISRRTTFATFEPTVVKCYDGEPDSYESPLVYAISATGDYREFLNL